MESSNSLEGARDLRNVTTYQAGVAQSAAHRLLQKICDEYLEQYGITKMHWLIIGSVLDAGEAGIRITDLAQIVQTGLPYLTTTINLLESKGILMRAEHSEDSRAKRVFVSPDFAAKCGDVEIGLRQRLRESIYSNVAVDDFLVYMKVLFQLGQLED